MLIKLVLGEETINIISAYAPEIALKNPLSKNFGWTKDELIQGLPYQEKIFIGGEVMLEKIVASLKEFISWRPRILNKQ